MARQLDRVRLDDPAKTKPENQNNAKQPQKVSSAATSSAATSASATAADNDNKTNEKTAATTRQRQINKEEYKSLAAIEDAKKVEAEARARQEEHAQEKKARDKKAEEKRRRAESRLKVKDLTERVEMRIVDKLEKHTLEDANNRCNRENKLQALQAMQANEKQPDKRAGKNHHRALTQGDKLNLIKARKQSEHDMALKTKVLSQKTPPTRLTRSQSGARRPNSPNTRSSSKNGRARTGAVR